MKLECYGYRHWFKHIYFSSIAKQVLATYINHFRVQILETTSTVVIWRYMLEPNDPWDTDLLSSFLNTSIELMIKSLKQIKYKRTKVSCYGTKSLKNNFNNKSTCGHEKIKKNQESALLVKMNKQWAYACHLCPDILSDWKELCIL
jgi:hypothetical protein